jgi:glycosyltransferase involved in cell wall biosynthesis
VVGSLGRLHQQKGYDVLMQAVALLPEAVRGKLAVVIWGEGPERPALENLRAQLSLLDSVFLPGQRADAVAALPKLDLYVQPSRFEGTPNAVMEAAAAGVPVVASAVDGLFDLVEAGWELELVEWDATGQKLSQALATALIAMRTTSAAGRKREARFAPVREAPPPGAWIRKHQRNFQLSAI